MPNRICLWQASSAIINTDRGAIDVKKIREPRLDRNAFSVGSLTDDSADTLYWLERNPAERLEAVEKARQILYSYNPLTDRIQRILKIADLNPG